MEINQELVVTLTFINEEVEMLNNIVNKCLEKKAGYSATRHFDKEELEVLKGIQSYLNPQNNEQGNNGQNSNLLS